MDIRQLTPDFSVAPQIEPQDMADIAALGYKTVICNRPDAENPPSHSAEVMAQEAKAHGLTFLVNQFPTPMLSMEHVTAQRGLLDQAEGPILAYCASGTRSTMVWALSVAGQMPTDDIIAAAARGGYALDGMRGQIDALASGN
ncbi:TIGR01244 family sulfur transferase [Nereida sp. MMG025]|uniref:TIGR01244 family sulfur transferase n=1 Tax=Nereida sp. MMG025 TaxID=2909981 RepID=UPI001F235F90|nr:TIGR01244 family sulfur transferase [Nereida sp. MMG025]MCF6443707.1 TIGR01244 family sulfur transferase [Nereida sp. MMG025]